MPTAAVTSAPEATPMKAAAMETTAMETTVEAFVEISAVM
jgi:hypothetical protein